MRIRRRAPQISRRGLAALLIVGVAGGGTTTAALRHHADPPSVTGAVMGLRTGTAPPIRPAVHTVALPAGARQRPTSLAPRRTQRFSLIGATWDDPRASLGGSLRVRTRSATTGAWHPWVDLTADDEPGDPHSARGGTAPVWVGDSDAVELRTRTSGAALPRGLRLDLVDPNGTAGRRTGGTGAGASTDRIAPAGYVVADASTPTTAGGASSGTASSGTASSGTASSGTASPGTAPSTAPSTGSAPTGEGAGLPISTTASAPSSTTPFPSTTPVPASSLAPTAPTAPPTGAAPAMVSRAGWQADESMRGGAPQYAAAVKVVFVHHTTSSNTYSCAESPAMVRSMYAYHTLSLGWNDIGYNFLVDKCGTVFEGRYGGTTRPVIGAHTYGFNTNSTSIAVIGSHTSSPASSAALASVARLAVWKLAPAGLRPTGTASLVEGASDSHRFTAGRAYSFNTISGHRDGYATECPGDALYAQLPAVRTLAASGVPANGPIVTVTGANAAGSLYYTTGRITITWTAAVPASGVTGYSVLVDGKLVATTAPSTRSAALALTRGKHSITIRTERLTATPPGPTTEPAPSSTTTPITATTPTTPTTPTTARSTTTATTVATTSTGGNPSTAPARPTRPSPRSSSPTSPPRRSRPAPASGWARER